MPSPAVGAPAPDFTLPGTTPEGRRDFALSSERGHPVVLAFYPADNTPGCTRQLCSYQHDLDVFRGLDATLWGISTQDLDSHEKFAAGRGLTFPLLADVDATVSKLYGVHRPLITRRSVFVIDAEGRLAWSHVSTLGLTHQSVDTIAEVLRTLQASTYPADGPSGVERQRRDA